MKNLLNAKSVAIIGASNSKGKVGNMLATNLIQYGYNGKYYFINPKGEDILGQRSYTSLSEIEGDVDVAVVAIPGDFVEGVISGAAHKCKNFVVISAGFGESGIEGHNKEIRLGELARKEGLTIVGPNCLGYITPALNLNASFAPGMPDDGSVAFISQSGALAVALVDKAKEFGLGFSSVISIGNKMQVDAASLIDHFARDKKTNVIALYLEGIKDGDAFLAAAYKARSAGKHIILLKSGRSEQAQNAIALHTGSLAGDDAVIDAVCARAGVTRVDSIAELFDVIRVASVVSVADLPHGHAKQRVAIITNAGGPGVVATDAIARTSHIETAVFSKEQESLLADGLPLAASAHNPIDLLGDALTDRYDHALRLCKDFDNVDVLFILLTPQKQTPAEEIANSAITAHKTSGKIVIVSFIGGQNIEIPRAKMRAQGVLFFDAPDAAIRAIDKLNTNITYTHKPLGKAQSEKEQVSDIFETMKEQKRVATYFHEAKKVAEIHGINTSVFYDVTEGFSGDTQISYPCVAKVDNPRILHKSDRGGVILPIRSLPELESATKKLLEDFPESGTRIIAQPFAEIQTELIIGMKKDPTFGPVIVVGIGGIYTEIFKKSQIFLTPTDHSVIKDELEKGPLDFLFEGARGQTPYDADKVADAVRALMQLSHDHDEVQAIDINPFLIYNDGRESLAVDVKIVLS